jgi:hypothetical protein
MVGPDREIIRVLARVIGCITPGCVDVILGPDFGMLNGGVPTVLPSELVPYSLRMANTEFVVVWDRRSPGFIAIEPLG